MTAAETITDYERFVKYLPSVLKNKFKSEVARRWLFERIRLTHPGSKHFAFTQSYLDYINLVGGVQDIEEHEYESRRRVFALAKSLFKTEKDYTAYVHASQDGTTATPFAFFPSLARSCIKTRSQLMWDQVSWGRDLRASCPECWVWTGLHHRDGPPNSCFLTQNDAYLGAIVESQKPHCQACHSTIDNHVKLNRFISLEEEIKLFT